MFTTLLRRRGRRPVLFAVLLALLTAGLVTTVGARPALATIGTNDYPSSLASPAKDSVVDSWGFYNRECTSFVAWRLNNDNGVAFSNNMKGGHWGNADQWKANATSIGYTYNSTPAKGSVAWWDDNYHGAGSSGHVAYVDDVNYNADGSVKSIDTEDYNAAGTGAYATHTILTTDTSGPGWPSGFIHIADLPLPPPSSPYDPRLRSSAHVTADFTGDGRPDVAVLYDYGSNNTAVLVFANSGGSGFSAPVSWWSSGAGNWIWGDSKPLVGDFNGDGRPDIAIAYDYGNSDMGLMVLTNNSGTSFNSPQAWYRSGVGGVNLWDAKLMVADFSGDGRPDVGMLYDYGNNDTALLVFTNNSGTAFNAPTVWWNSGAGNWIWGSSTPLVGDFSGDGRPDVAIMYDYGNSDTGLLVLTNNSGTSFNAPVSWYRSGAGGIAAGAAWPIVGDFNGDGRLDVLMMYAYNNNWTKFLLFSNSGSSSFSSPSAIWDSGNGNWTWGASVPLTANFNGSGGPDVMIMYNYGSNDTGLDLLANTGTGLGSPAVSWWRSGAGNFNWGVSTAF